MQINNVTKVLSKC